MQDAMSSGPAGSGSGQNFSFCSPDVLKRYLRAKKELEDLSAQYADLKLEMTEKKRECDSLADELLPYVQRIGTVPLPLNVEEQKIYGAPGTLFVKTKRKTSHATIANCWDMIKAKFAAYAGIRDLTAIDRIVETVLKDEEDVMRKNSENNVEYDLAQSGTVKRKASRKRHRVDASVLDALERKS